MKFQTRHRTGARRPARPRWGVSALALAAACCWAGSASAVPIGSPTSLSALLAPGATLTVPGAVFSNFTYATPSPGGTPVPDPGSVTVTTTSTGSSVGLVFNGNEFHAFGAQSIADQLTFDVTVTSPSQSINSANLSFFAATNGAGSASIVENIKNASQQLGQGVVVQQQSLNNGGIPSALITFADQKTFEVDKGIALSGSAFPTNNVNDYANIFSFTQTFSFDSPVPEPASFAMMLLGSGVFQPDISGAGDGANDKGRSSNV